MLGSNITQLERRALYTHMKLQLTTNPNFFKSGITYHVIFIKIFLIFFNY